MSRNTGQTWHSHEGLDRNHESEDTPSEREHKAGERDQKGCPSYFEMLRYHAENTPPPVPADLPRVEVHADGIGGICR
jgi:hypothetical protein